MDGPTASVVICVYNRPIQVVECLESLLAMDFKDFEIVVVDDASTDDTADQLEHFRQSHPRIPMTIVRNEHNLGVSGARNAGLKAAQGEFVFFTDSDCTVDRGWLGTFLKVFDQPDVGAVSGLVLDVVPQTLAECAYVGTCRIGSNKWQRRDLVGSNMGFRRTLVVRYRFDEALTYYCDEEDIAWRMQRNGHHSAFVPEAVVHHHHHMHLYEYLRQAVCHGRGAARLWYKYGMYVGRDLWALTAGLLALPLAILEGRFLYLVAFFGSLQVAALVYNERVFKRKKWLETLYILPVCILYTVMKGWGVFTTLLRIAYGGEQAIRASKQRLRYTSHRTLTTPSHSKVTDHHEGITPSA